MAHLVAISALFDGPAVQGFRKATLEISAAAAFGSEVLLTTS